LWRERRATTGVEPEQSLCHHSTPSRTKHCT
jgi:hypothetical protein